MFYSNQSIKFIAKIYLHEFLYMSLVCTTKLQMFCKCKRSKARHHHSRCKC
jgi:hypothetical protein